MKGLLLAASPTVAVGVIFLAVVTIARAEPAKGVSPNVIGRATFDAFNLHADPRAGVFGPSEEAGRYDRADA
jgi:hypothetical protein